MPDIIIDGTGTGNRARVTGDNRLTAEAVTEPISSERSRVGKLFGCGTGGLTLDSSMSGGSILWLKNNGTAFDFYVQKLIFGWNGGSTTWLKTFFSLIFYNTTVPTGNNTEITAAIENIRESGTSAAVTDSDFLGYKWDGNSTGMTGITGGFAQIPNRIAKGNTSIAIDGEIILGPGNSMEFQVTPEETGLGHVSVVYYKVPVNEERGDDF